MVPKRASVQVGNENYGKQLYQTFFFLAMLWYEKDDHWDPTVLRENKVSQCVDRANHVAKYPHSLPMNLNYSISTSDWKTGWISKSSDLFQMKIWSIELEDYFQLLFSNNSNVDTFMWGNHQLISIKVRSKEFLMW